ncbi:MAG: hypothetical protein JW702_09500 [Clostridiales bacterium]|nr:hypothetical protein [Clostridiales bacterium]
MSNIEKVFPVVEFRIDTFVAANRTDFEKINLHIIFDIDESDLNSEIKKITQNFLMRLNLSALTKHENIPLTRENLIEYSEGKTLQSGFDNIFPSTQSVFKLMTSDMWKDKVHIFLGYPEWNKLDYKRKVKEYKTELFDFTDSFFTAAPTVAEVLDKGQWLEEFGDKPLVHSLDIHNFENLEADNYRCFTWIKSDFSFSGLNQIKYEPKDRIKISVTNPKVLENKTNVIESIMIKNASNWFKEKEIPLNRGLVTIIGEKGSGKTALLDMIAISNHEGIYESHPANPSSFYFRANKDGQLKGVQIDTKLEGLDEISTVNINSVSVEKFSNSDARVRYLSLKELENYSTNKVALQEFIQRIINANDASISDLQFKSTELLKEIKSINDSIEEDTEKLITKVKMEQALKTKSEESSIHNKNEPKINTLFDIETEKIFKELLIEESKIKDLIETKKETLHELPSVKSWLKEKEQSIHEEVVESIKTRTSEYKHIGRLINENIKVDIKITGIDSLNDSITQFDLELLEHSKSLIGIAEKLKPLQQQNSNFEEEQTIQKKWLEKKSELEQEVKDLQNNLDKMKVFEENLEKFKTQRRQKYIKLIETKLEQKKKFNLLKRKIIDNDVTFDISLDFDFKSFEDIENDIVNHNSGNSQADILIEFRKLFMKIESELNDINLPQDEVFNGNYSESIATIVNELFEIDNLSSFVNMYFGKDDVGKLLKKSFSISSFFNMIFNDYYSVNYNILFEGKSLNLLSPGQKGLVLMKLFLKLDTSSKPILIDQPEDNIDNRSVYRVLKNDIREAKKKRQIIIATHNPNLVVNTDAEQIIVAHFQDVDKSKDGEDEGIRITYESGGLEDKNIRGLVCNILEGGTIAFLKREERYNLKKKYNHNVQN